MEEYSGGCLCGGVLFKLKGPLRPVIYCHCSQCRKTQGHFAAYTAVPRKRIEWRKKESLSSGTIPQIRPAAASAVTAAPVCSMISTEVPR